jgi:hypothetical protein
MLAGFLPLARRAVSAVLIASAAHAVADETKYPWDQRPPGCFEPATLAQRPRYCNAPEWTDFADSKRKFDRLLAEPDYQLVDRAAGELGFSQARFPSGEYHFEALYLSMVSNFQFTGAHGASIAKEWLQTAGQQGYGQLAQALVYYGRATNARTNRAARTVSPEAWELYYQNLEQSYATLEAASPRLKATGPWHALKVSLVFEHPKYAGERLKVLQAAVAAWPDYLALYVIPMERMHPQRGGSFELMEGVAQFTLSLTRATQGAAMYALAYERVFRTENAYTLNDSNVDWLLLKEGIRDIERRRSVTPLLWKNFAQLACQVDDQPEARRLYDIYDGILNGSLGSMTDESDPCRAFAMAHQ